MTTQRHAQASLQFANAKGFNQIVIGTGIQRGDFIRLFSTGREHENRHLAPLTNLTNKIDAVAIRQPRSRITRSGLRVAASIKPR